MTARHDALRVLRALYEHAAYDDAWAEIRSINPGGGAAGQEFISARDVEDIVDRSVELRERANVFFGVSPRTRPEGTKSAVELMPAVWADIDCTDALLALAGFELEPSILIASGSTGGHHAYWILAEPIDPSTGEAINAALAETLTSDPAVKDAGRILRLPGTLNHKSTPPHEVSLVQFTGHRYRAEELLEAVRPTQPAVAPERRSNQLDLDRVLSQLDGVREQGDGWMARCPAHDDQTPSLKLAAGADGRLLIHCFGGCEPEAIVKAIGLTMRDLFPPGTGGADDDEGQGLSLAALLVHTAIHAGVKLFHTDGGVAHARVPVDDHYEVWAISSRRFKRWLRMELREVGSFARADALAEATEMLSAMADFDGPELPVAVRTAWTPEGLDYNLADSAGHVVHVTPNGWTIDSTTTAMFVRRDSMLALPVPHANGSHDLLRKYVNVESDDDFMLIVSWVLMAMRPSGPYPVLVLLGEQGSAKSTLSRVLKALVDPGKAPLRALPSSLRDLAISAESNVVLAIDNLPQLKDGMSDALCRLSTGGGFATRALYTDDEERVFEQMRPVLLNGLDAVVTRQDLLGRAIVIRLPKIGAEARLDEQQFWDAFEQDRPHILGALFDAASAGLTAADTVDGGGFRMADFARWSAATLPTFGWTREAFAAAYESNLSGALRASLEGSLLASIVIRLMENRDVPIQGVPAEVRQALQAALTDEERTSRMFPKNAQTMSASLTLLSPALAEVGIEVITTSRGRDNDKTRWLVIRNAQPGTQGTQGTQAAGTS